MLDKAWLGDGQKNGLFAILLRDAGCAAAARCMSRMAKLAARFLCDVGFSIGIGDVMPTPNLTALKVRVRVRVGVRVRVRLGSGSGLGLGPWTRSTSHAPVG